MDFATSDTHFFHDNILKYESMSQFRSNLYKTGDEMNTGMIEIWNKIVGPDDTVYHNGDFCFGYGNKLKSRLEWLLPQLNGKIILVRGNHDPKAGDEVFIKYGHKVYEMYNISVEKQLIVLCHYPLVSWNKGHYGSIMMHGHCHGKYQGQGRIIDIGWDVHGKPMKMKDLIDIANKRPVVSVDGH
jgi:calcineurin-like phosphoesterase family protein